MTLRDRIVMIKRQNPKESHCQTVEHFMHNIREQLKPNYRQMYV